MFLFGRKHHCLICDRKIDIKKDKYGMIRYSCADGVQEAYLCEEHSDMMDTENVPGLREDNGKKTV